MAIQDGYAICINEWATDLSIKNELGLLLIISSLTAQEGYCFAENSYFASLFNCDETFISRKIRKLQEKGYITITYQKRGAEITRREIRLTKMSTVGLQKSQPSIDENVNRDIIINNNINKNINNKNIYARQSAQEREKKRFVAPTVEEVRTYCQERDNGVDAEQFVDFYTAKGWRVGQNPMKDWRAAVRTWERRHPKLNEDDSFYI